MWPPPQPKSAAAEQTHSIARLSTCPRGFYRRGTASIPAEEMGKGRYAVTVNTLSFVLMLIELKQSSICCEKQRKLLHRTRGSCARWCACTARLCSARLSITVMAVVTDLHRVSFPPNGGLACRRPVETSLSQDKEVSESRLFQLCLHYSKAGKKCQGAARGSSQCVLHSVPPQ